MSFADLQEHTWMPDELFPINIFNNRADGSNVLYLHWHEHLELIYMIRGEAVFDIGGETYSAAPGDLMFVKSGQLHSGYSVRSESIEYAAVVFHPSLLVSTAADIQQANISAPLMNGLSSLPNHVPASSVSSSELAIYIQSLLSEFSKKEWAYEIHIHSYLHLIIAHLLRHCSRRSSDIKKDNHHQIERLKPLFNYLEHHYHEKISLQKAADIVNLSQYHFCKTFKKITGRTFVEFLQLKRVNEAERLIRETDRPITLISEQVGFCSLHYFDRVFKKLKRYPPSETRKETNKSHIGDYEPERRNQNENAE